MQHFLWFDYSRSKSSLWVSLHLCERPVNNPTIWKESLTWIVLWIRFVRGVNLEGWRAGCRPWGVGDDGRIGNLLKKTQCERSDISQRNKKLFLQSKMDESKLLEEIKTWELPLRYENQKGLLQHLTARFQMPVKRLMTSGPCQETSKTNITLDQESKLYSPREEPFPIPLKYIDVSRTTCTNLEVTLEKRIDDYLNIDGSRDLSDPLTSFTLFILYKKQMPHNNIFCTERFTKRKATSRPQHLWPELWTKWRSNAKLKFNINGQLKKQSSIMH